jgi:hypothetical protein
VHGCIGATAFFKMSLIDVKNNSYVESGTNTYIG